MNKKGAGLLGLGVIGGGLLVYSLYNSDEKKARSIETAKKFCGLKNEGRTCYLNSIIQYVLFHLPFFRRVIYNLDAEDSTQIEALQNLFLNMQMGEKKYVSTQELIDSFGWNKRDVYAQHDGHEFIVKILQLVQKTMDKEKQFEDVIPFLFQYTQKNIIQCDNVDYASENEELFYTLELEVRRCRTMNDSLKKYLSIEKFKGSNRYQTPENGLQEAKKSTYFEHLPPVMMVHLKRFHFDGLQFSKVTTSLRFEETLIMHEIKKIEVSKDDQEEYKELEGEVLSRSIEKEKEFVVVRRDIEYVLYAVLVHEGRLINHGHYYVYINTSKKPEEEDWILFNDHKVRKALKSDALEGSSRAAYMLVYVQKKSFERVMKDIEIPGHILDRGKMCSIM